MRLRPCQRLGDLSRAGFPRDHGQIRNPHQHLKVGRDDVEVRRAPDIGAFFGAPHETRIVASMTPYIFGISEPIVNLALGIGGDVRRRDLKMDFNPDRSLRIPRSFLRDKNYKNMPSEATLHMIPYASSRLSTTVPYVHFLSPPVILSSEILRDFEQYVTDEGVSFTDLIPLSAWEADWHGYFSFKFSRGRITPIEPLFLHFNRDESLNDARKMGVSRNSLSKNFLGLTLVARRQSELQL
jgi:hypothetical protein